MLQPTVASLQFLLGTYKCRETTANRGFKIHSSIAWCLKQPGTKAEVHEWLGVLFPSSVFSLMAVYVYMYVCR